MAFSWALAVTFVSSSQVSPVSATNSHALYRCIDSGGDHYVALAQNCNGGTLEFELGCAADASESGNAALYDCLNGVDHFQSLDQSCEGYTVVSRLGFVWSAPRTDATRALYRCLTGGDHFVSLNEDCEGTKLESRLGYVSTSCASPPSPSPSPPGPSPAPLGTLVIANEQIGVEVDLAHGCSISGAWATGDASKTNIINTADLGRYVQVSYYSGPSAFNGCTFRGQQWPWNPIGAGDKDGNPAQIISSAKSAVGDVVTCSMRPIQWACSNVLCDCVVDLVYTLSENAVLATASLRMDRSDKTVYGARDQELPAVYTNGPFYRLVGYTGSAPCTGDETVQEWNAGFDNTKPFPWLPGKIDTLTEPVLTLLRQDDFGLGVYSSAMEHFIAGFSGTKGSGGTKDGSTGYIAPVATMALSWNEVYNYSFALIIGKLPDIRKKACKLHALDRVQHTNTSIPAWV